MGQALLPIVNPEVGFSITQKLGDKSDKAIFVEQMGHIESANPVVAEFIRQWSGAEKGDAFVSAAFCGILVYLLLESQAEVNHMENNLGL